MESIVAWVGENWVNILAWSTEFLAVLFCIHGVFGEKFRVNVVVMVMLVIDIATYAAIWEELWSENFSSITYIITFVYCLRIFKKKISETICYYVLSIVSIGTIEIIATYIMLPMEEIIIWRELLMLVLNTVTLLLAGLFYKFVPVGKKIRHRLEDKRLFVTILICGLAMIFMLVDYRHRGKVDRIYYLVFMVLVIIVYSFWAKAQKVQFELEKKKLELEMQEVYGAAYKELIYEVRRKQHDFMNQLGAVYSMHVTARTLEELIEKQREYGATLINRNRYDKILTGCNNSILAGYLYNKCVGFENSNVIVEYKIHVDTAECNLLLHEVIEILGILLTNAFENINTDKVEDKVIELIVEETCEHLNIEVSNVSKYLASGDIEKIFDKEYSSKGKNRGIGLARMKQLAEKSGSDIIVENHVRIKENWIKFQIVIPK